MKILLVGQAAFAEQVLQRLVDRGDEVVAVYCPPDRSSAKFDPVKTRAGDLGIPVRQHASLKKPEVVDEFRSLRPDLAVLAYVTQIVPESVIHIPRNGTICFHPSLLPRYRGGSAINWQIIKGETKTGVTVFFTDAGIDTGPILLQKEAVISEDATAGSLYYDTLFPLGVDAVVESVALVDAGEAPKLPQDEASATYDPLCRDEHAGIAWDRPARETYNLIRGCDPQPGAHTRWEGRILRLYDARLLSETIDGEPPGAVLRVGSEGLTIAARDGAVRVGRARVDGEGGKMGAAELASGLGLGVGGRLG